MRTSQADLGFCFCFVLFGFVFFWGGGEGGDGSFLLPLVPGSHELPNFACYKGVRTPTNCDGYNWDMFVNYIVE